MDPQGNGNRGEGPGGEQVQQLLNATEAIAQGDYYKDMSVQLQGELGRLAEFINKIKSGMMNVSAQARYTSQRIPEASLELSGVRDVTMDAANTMLELTEKVMEGQGRLAALLKGLKAEQSAPALEEMESIVEANNGSLVSMMATLSFQDMAGQRMNKVIKMVDEVESRILEILLHLGARIEGKEGAAFDRKLRMLQMLQERRENTDLKQDLVDTILDDLGLT